MKDTTIAAGVPSKRYQAMKEHMTAIGARLVGTFRDANDYSAQPNTLQQYVCRGKTFFVYIFDDANGFDVFTAASESVEIGETFTALDAYLGVTSVASRFTE